MTLRVPKQFVDQVMWPGFKKHGPELWRYLDEVAIRIIREEVHGDSSEANEIQQTWLKP